MNLTTRSRSIPLAPRPLPGEAVTSWIGRIAARYDLPPAALITGLRDGGGIPASRLASIDRSPDPELEHLLAKAACVEVGRIGALRAAAHGLSDWAAPFRDTLAWCPVCVREDVARWGESYEHAIWRLSCCAVCVTHGQVLVQVCPLCARGRGEYHPSGGRWRLVCESCEGRIDTSTNHRRETALGISGAKLFGWTVDPGWVPLACELQSSLLAAIADTDRAGARASRLVIVVRDLAAAFLRPAASGPSSPPRDGVISTGPADTFAALKPAAAFEMLGLIASVLASIQNGHSSRPRIGRRDNSRPDLTVMDLPWFVGMLPRADRQRLYHAAQQWSPALVRAMERASSFEAARRHGANRIPDQARRDATWVKAAVPRLRAAAIRRIAARAYRRVRARHDLTARGSEQDNARSRLAGLCHQ